MMVNRSGKGGIPFEVQQDSAKFNLHAFLALGGGEHLCVAGAGLRMVRFGFSRAVTLSSFVTKELEESMNFTVYNTETAPAAAKESLKAAENSMGFLPNLLGTLAEAPIALKAYLDLTDLLEQSSLSPIARQVLMLAISHENSCEYCMAAHSTVAGIVGMARPGLTALRNGTPIPDMKLEALRSFAVEVVSTRGRVDAPQVAEFLAAGYTRQNILEVVFGVAMKTLSNYAGHLTHTPVDAEFLPQSWSSARVSPAIAS